MRHIQTYNFGIDNGVMVRLDDYKQLEAENAALREQLTAREQDFRTQDTLLEKIAELQQRIAELELENAMLRKLVLYGDNVWKSNSTAFSGEGVA